MDLVCAKAKVEFFWKVKY